MGEMLMFFFSCFLVLAVAWSALSFIFSPRRTFGVINSTWHHSFDNQPFSPLEFYTSVEQKLKEKGIENMYIDTVGYNIDKFVFTKRKYLQICRNNQMILVCAAPFGKDFFISWRQGERIDFLLDLFIRIPLIGNAIARMIVRKTFYQMDADTMFKEAVHHAVISTIEGMAKANGIRPLTEAERAPVDISQVAIRF